MKWTRFFKAYSDRVNSTTSGRAKPQKEIMRAAAREWNKVKVKKR